MKTTFLPSVFTRKTTAYLLLLSMLLLVSNKIIAQSGDHFECYMDSTMFQELDSAARYAAQSNYGFNYTPQGVLKVMVIYAGYTNDKDKRGGKNPITGIIDNSMTWPYYDLNADSLNTFPNNTWNLFYDDTSDFSPSNTDNSISNFYYQMSLTSGSPLKMIAEVFPERINVPAQVGIGFSTYTLWVYDSIQAKYPGYDFGNCDGRLNNPMYQYNNEGTGADDKIDYAIIVWRYSNDTLYNPVKGMTGLFGANGAYADISGYTFKDSLNNPTFAINGGFTMCKGINGLNKVAFTHESGHTNYGAPHCNSANGVVGNYFYGNYGWGMMRSSLTPHVYDCANGWERWYNGWIELTSNNNTLSSEINSIADLQNGGVYTLYDFINTGDVIRVKLPHVSNQYLWLENHAGTNSFDNRDGWDYDRTGNNLIPAAPRGLVAYIEGMRYSRGYTAGYSTNPNSIKYLNANGNFDFTNDYASSEPTIPEYWGIAYDFENNASNPLGGHNQLTLIRNDFYGSTSTITYNPDANGYGAQNEQRDFIVENSNVTFGALGIGMSFPTGGGANMGANPVVTNLQTYDKINAKLSPIYLNGISFRVLSYNADSSVTVQIKMDNYDINNSTRYTGNIVLSPNVVSSSTPSLNIKTGQNLDIDKSGTPNRHTITADNDFINPTVFTCESGSFFHSEPNATVNVKNGSTLHLKSGSKLELEAGAALRIKAHSSLIIDNGAELNLKPGSFLIIDDSATVIWKNSTTNKGILLGSTSYTGNPAIVEVHGNITFTSGAKWTHNRDGFYRFHPTNSMFFQYPSSVNFTGKGKTRKMVELTNNTTLSISNVDDVDWNSGLVQYGSNSKIELNNVNFTSINATYNPASNPQTTSTAFELINPQATFFNACDFNKLNKGVVVNGNGALVHIQTGKFTDMTTYGVELDDVDNFKMTNGFVNGAQNALYAKNSTVVEISGTELKNATNGAVLENVAGAYFTNHANIHTNNTGIYATASLVFLRNGAKVHSNSSFGVQIYGTYDAGLGNYNAMLTMGDIGCGSVYNNSNYGIYGVDALLNIDAVQHSIDRGDNIIKPNRFDNNTYKTFEICYGSSAYAPSQINAKGNFWGVAPPDIQSSQYSFTANVCVSQGGTPVIIPLIHTNYSTCIPTNSCMDCSSCGGGSSSSSSMMAVQSSFSEANEVFVEEDNTATRNGFTNLSAVELIKDTVTDTWKGKSVNEVMFNLEKESVHLIQVSKAIKAKANNSTGRMMYIVEDVFKDVKPNELGGVTSTVSLYPNPTNDKLFIDVERVDNYRLILFNISGQKVLEQMLTDKHNLVNVNNLPVGTYFYELSAPNSNTVKGNIAITK